MRATDIDEQVSQQAMRLVRNGRSPCFLELGREQRAALSEAGHGGPTFVTTVLAGYDPGFHKIGDPYPVSEAKRIQLRVESVDRDNWLLVKE